MVDLFSNGNGNCLVGHFLLKFGNGNKMTTKGSNFPWDTIMVENEKTIKDVLATRRPEGWRNIY